MDWHQKQKKDDLKVANAYMQVLKKLARVVSMEGLEISDRGPTVEVISMVKALGRRYNKEMFE